MNIKALESKCASYKKTTLEHTHMVMKTRGEKTKRSRCPNGTRKNKKSGKCEKK